ncbi:MAG: hypothetical protein LBK82_06760, partial [Planctomycetaceae bacterium]|nr:hypothetical protein [Planctomycetaceae bacterium]
MSNNNLADISAFESLQNNQNAKTGMSSMSVFNTYDRNAITSAITAYKKIVNDIDAGEDDESAMNKYFKTHAKTVEVFKKEYKKLEEQSKKEPDNDTLKKDRDEYNRDYNDIVSVPAKINGQMKVGVPF